MAMRGNDAGNCMIMTGTVINGAQKNAGWFVELLGIGKETAGERRYNGAESVNFGTKSSPSSIGEPVFVSFGRPISLTIGSKILICKARSCQND